MRLAPVIFQLPSIIVLAIVLVSCFQWYLRGMHFVQGLHFFGMLLSMSVIVIACLASVLLVLVTGFVMRTRVRGKHIGFAVVTTVILALCAWPLMISSFAMGRTSAYRNLDFHALSNESQSLANELKPSGTYPLNIVWDRSDRFVIQDAKHARIEASLPYLKSLRPKSIFVHPTGVVLQMDGGGPASHEGVVVFLDVAASDTERLGNDCDLSLLDQQHEVYRFCVYDSRMLLPAE